ncbi:MAG TPA: S41 family peptidase [Thermoanaerobaculia bacterium]|jgi:carboxyl-terminal processing protease|nr:S41 family peptidase [Thermoanaerobaculia bacterium]
MTGNRTRFMVVSAVVTIALSAASWLAAEVRKQPPEPDSLYKYLSVFTEVLGLVRQAYVHDADVEQLMSGAYEGAADSLGPFTVYVPAEQVVAFRRLREHPAPDTGLFLVRERGWIYVAGVALGSAADKAGFQRGDLVSKIDGEGTRDLQVWQIEQLLAAHGGATVPFGIVRQGEGKQLKLAVQDDPALPAVSVQRVREVPVMRIARFGPATVAAVEGELRKLGKGSGKLAIDLRGVAGGDPDVAYQVADLLASGDLGSLMARDEVRQRFTASGPPVWSGRVAVLVDRGTLGAGEVLARVLDEAADAVVVGEATFGHAGHQAQVSLQSGAVVELTDAFYAGPKGKPVAESIEPDQVVDESSRKLNEKDLTLDELILQRGVGALEKPAAEPAQKAA